MADNGRRARMLKGIETAYRGYTDGTSEGMDEEAKKAIMDYAGKSPASPAIVGKPDPEQEANAQIRDAVNARKTTPAASTAPIPADLDLPPGMTMEEANRTINPDTGLPYSVPEQRIPGESEQDRQMRKMRLQVLRTISNQK